jgi:hypothetical protein
VLFSVQVGALHWLPGFSQVRPTWPKNIFEAYRQDVEKARSLVDKE